MTRRRARLTVRPSAGPAAAGSGAPPRGRSPAAGADRTAALAVLAAAVVWGTTGTAATFAPLGTRGLAVGAAGMGGGGLLLLAGAAVPAGRLLIDRRHRSALLAGAACVVVYPLAFYSAMAEAGVALGVCVTIGSAPVAAALLERALTGRRLSPRWLVAVAAAVAGAVLLAAGDPRSAHGGHPIAGAALSLLAGCCYAGYSVAAAGIMADGVHARGVVPAMFGLAAGLLLPISVAAGPGVWAAGRGLAVVGYLSVVPMAGGYLLFGWGLRRVPASTATAVSLAEPVAAALLADLVAGQALDPLGWLGVAVVAAAVPMLSAADGATAA